MTAPDGTASSGDRPSGEPWSLVAALGVEGVTGATAVLGGMSGARLWRLSRAGGDLLLRVLPGTALAEAEREATAQRAAALAGVPAPAVHHVGLVGDPPVPVILMGWAEGASPVDRIAAAFDPGAEAEAAGLASGRTLAAVHAVPLPGGWAADDRLARRWLSVVPAWLAPLVAGPGSGRRLLHFDYHPFNLLLRGGEVSAVLDWANAVVGDPRLDLGRTYACLQFGAILGAGGLGRDVIDRYWRGLVTGYGAAAMTLDELAPSMAVGLATLVDDRRRFPDAGVPGEAVDELAAEADAWLAMAWRFHGDAGRRG